jgi:hypothetical protein
MQMHKVPPSLLSLSRTYLTLCLVVHPAHLAFVLINQPPETGPGGAQSSSGTPLFASVIQRAGGDPVKLSLSLVLLSNLLLSGRRETRYPKTHRSTPFTKSTTR